MDEKVIYLHVNLPVTPKVGDRIDISTFVPADSFKWGYVYEVDHDIGCFTQEIHIWVQPRHNYYYHWIKMKEDYERCKDG